MRRPNSTYERIAEFRTLGASALQHVLTLYLFYFKCTRERQRTAFGIRKRDVRGVANGPQQQQAVCLFEKSEAGYPGAYNCIVHIARDAEFTEYRSIHSQYEQGCHHVSY